MTKAKQMVVPQRVGIRGVRPTPVYSPPLTGLEALFKPASVALIGASDAAGSVGQALARNLINEASARRVYFINPKRDTVCERRTFERITALPESVDLAVIATPAETVPGIVEECAAAGAKAAIIVSAGFRERCRLGVQLEQQIMQRRGRTRIIGPNCLGVMVPHAGLNATFAGVIAPRGNVAFLSQSGALCTAILDWGRHENVGFSGFVSVGSMVDVNWGDLIYHFGDDPHTNSIICYMESIADARTFLSAAREVALEKPIIVLKVGHTKAAAKAAASHTGALTGSDAVLDAAFRRVGVLRVDTLGELFDMAEVLAKQPAPKGPRLAIVTNAGGPGALATDMLVSSGGQLAPLGEKTMTALDAFLPPYWSHSNPIDILGDASPSRYSKAVECAAADPETDGLLAILTPQAMTDPTATANEIRRSTKSMGKPLLASWMGATSVDEGKAVLNAANIPTFDTPETAARAFALMWQYSENLRALYETPSLDPSATENPTDRANVEDIIRAAQKARRTLLTEVESKQILAAYGIPAVGTAVASTEDEAVTQAEALGFPVVIKLLSKTLTHKSDIGGVHLNLQSSTAVRHAWRAIQQSVTERAGQHHFLGVTVQRMVVSDGYEIILGSSIDPHFGPVLMFGAGGKLVEVLNDLAHGLPPLNATLARRLMERTRIHRALQGLRGEKPLDMAALEQLLVRFSQLVAEHSWIAEIEINPLLVSSQGMLALDARVILHPADTPEGQLPRLAIQPYPSRYVTSWKLKNGLPVTIRPIRPEDEPSMVRFHKTLSDQSVYYRYFGPSKLEQRICHERLSRRCFIDYDREMALVVEHEDPKSGRREILALGTLSRLHGVNEAEFAVIVSDEWQGHGIGTELLQRLIQIGRDTNLARISAVILPDNFGMQRIAEKAGFTLTQDGGDCLAEIAL